MYFDEEMILDLRLNILNTYVDYFVIVESKYNHKGERRKLLFNKEKFSNFKDKIIYLIYDEIPLKVEKINLDDNEETKDTKYIMNALYRENGQRNYIINGLSKANDDDIIFISDVDEIPKIDDVNFAKLNNKIILFKQDMFYYKFNLCLPNFKWTGSKACKKKNLISPQWLRNIKDRKYPFFRIDTFFSNKKYTNIEIIKDGGWHFSNIKTAKEIEHKLRSYLHHKEFDDVPLSVQEIDKLVQGKQAIYDLKVDKRVNKIGNGSILEKFEINKLPNYIQANQNILKEWID
jgi:beta-1,4-mannosyl-glycoprotein beta-1,4-N-acetylglucosaminyltransferase|tara:strand:- start:361 stop:1230 length:870 start_codon:yes stop_codon:yes gene_type:complete